MIKDPHSASRQGLALADNLTLVEHNSLGSWDVFLSLFSCLTKGPPVHIVLLQDPPSSKDFLPCFAGFKPFAPPVSRPKVACYISQNVLQSLSVLPVFFPESKYFMALDMYTPQGCLRSTFPRFRLGNVYAMPINHPNHSVSPETACFNYNLLYLVAGDFNIYNPPVDPFRVLG